MSYDTDEIIREILNPKEEESTHLRSWSVSTKKVNEINIIDLKGKRFKFPGKYIMTESNGSVSFKAIEG